MKLNAPLTQASPVQRILCLRQIGKGVAGGVGMAEEQELDALLAVVEHELVVEDEVRHLEMLSRTSLRPIGPLPASANSFGPLTTQQAGAVGLGDDARALLGEDRVAVGVVAVMVRVEDIADRFIGGLLDGGDDVARLLGEVGVDDDDVILEDDPDVIAAAEGDVLARSGLMDE